jgi:site-specific DNA-methyltransferase (adenine-specific)
LLTLDKALINFFNNFSENIDEIGTAHDIQNAIMKHCNKFEKNIFYLRVIQGYSYYTISDLLKITYRKAQIEYQKVIYKIAKIAELPTSITNILDKKIEEYMPFYNNEDKYLIYNDDFLNGSFLGKNKIDLIITSPPYNVNASYNIYNDDLNYNDYLDWSKKWLEVSYNISKDDCRMCVNLPVQIPPNLPIHVDFINIAKTVGWQYKTTIFWNKNQIKNRMCTGSVFSPSSPYIQHPLELIIIMYKKQWNKINKNGVATISKDEWWELTNSLWTFAPGNGKKFEHPAVFPIKLPEKCIKLLSYKNDTILDPFLGVGTTMVAAAQLQRNCIGFDIDNKYCKTAKHRLLYEGLPQKTLFELEEQDDGE